MAEPGQSLADDVERGPPPARWCRRYGSMPTVAGRWTGRFCDRGDRRRGYVEQPCRTVEELAQVRRRVDVPIVPDESIRKADDPMRVVAADAADIADSQIARLGGMRAVLTLAEQIGLPVVVSSALDSAVGIAAGVAAGHCPN